ncbi:MAG: nickel-dependent lactate racemase [Acidobacteria bacterium]|nr:nickel-dependent lactate racemase [Acidobacteriota bacterium]
MLTLRWGPRQIPVPRALSDWPVLDAPGLAPSAAAAAPWRRAAARAAEMAAASLGPAGRLALVIPDRTRPLPLPDLLPPLLRELAARGVGPRRVTIVPASGMHRPMSAGELAEWIGEEAAGSGALLAPHDARAPAVLLGTTRSGVPVAAHPAVALAGTALVVGRIVFHYLAGFGGGRKLLVPGTAALHTIVAVHSRCLAPRAGAGRHPRARAGILDGNPVHEAACEAAGLFPPAVAIHVSLDAAGSIAEARAGDVVDAHAQAARTYGAAHRVTLDDPLDAVVVSAGGHPADRDLVQAHKALDAVAPVVKDGGTVVLVAACRDGLGNPELAEGLALGGPAEIERELRRRFRVGVHTALALAEKTRRLQVAALSELPDEALALCGMRRVGSLDEAAALVRERHGAAARAALAPRGGALVYDVSG